VEKGTSEWRALARHRTQQQVLLLNLLALLVQNGARLRGIAHSSRFYYSIYWLYWYKSTNTDAAAARSARAATQHSFAPLDLLALLVKSTNTDAEGAAVCAGRAGAATQHRFEPLRLACLCERPLYVFCRLPIRLVRHIEAYMSLSCLMSSAYTPRACSLRLVNFQARLACLCERPSPVLTRPTSYTSTLTCCIHTYREAYMSLSCLMSSAYTPRACSLRLVNFQACLPRM
jgi:hypothetical protein